MNIAIPTADYPPIEGGISTVTVQVARELARLGHDVTVVAPHFNQMDHFDSGEPVTVVRYGGYGLGWLRYAPMARVAGPHLARADCAVAINVAYGGLMAKRRGVPFVVLAYGYEFLKFRRNPLVRRLLLDVYCAAGRVVAISSYTRDALLEFGVHSDQIEVILPGAPQASDAAQEVSNTHADRGPTILAVGRFMPRKGHEMLLRGLPKVVKRFPDVRLVFVGRGPRLAPVQQLAADLRLSDRVTFLSQLSDPELAEQYRACDVFALPTGEEPGGHVEGFGLVFTEAQAYGKPVIAGRSGGTVDAVLHEQTGLLVEPGDPDSVADALLRVLSDPGLAKYLGENGKKRVESELNWTHFTAKLAAILENLA